MVVMKFYGAQSPSEDLMTNAFFEEEEDCGFRVDVVSQAENKVVFRLRVIDPNKRTHMHKENEAVQFEFDLETDSFDAIGKEMVKFSIIFEDDANTVAQLLKTEYQQYLQEQQQLQQQWTYQQQQPPPMQQFDQQQPEYNQQQQQYQQQQQQQQELHHQSPPILQRQQLLDFYCL